MRCIEPDGLYSRLSRLRLKALREISGKLFLGSVKG
uniref:Uncharacterized protein n=1 Tax=Anguilla anguilla TaxID=7936 RepID=A0A0E9QSB8_ANGAN